MFFIGLESQWTDFVHEVKMYFGGHNYTPKEFCVACVKGRGAGVWNPHCFSWLAEDICSQRSKSNQTRLRHSKLLDSNQLWCYCPRQKHILKTIITLSEWMWPCKHQAITQVIVSVTKCLQVMFQFKYNTKYSSCAYATDNNFQHQYTKINT